MRQRKQLLSSTRYWKADSKMNPYIKDLNRIEFLITLACTGRCRHCSEGEHPTSGEHIDAAAAVQVIYTLCSRFHINSLMTFGGEPLLYIDEVCKIHSAAEKMGIPKRQLITNGFFSRDEEKIKDTVRKLAQSGVNDILLSVDAFHQETIPLQPVRYFAEAAKAEGLSLRTNPAWLEQKEAQNPYNRQTEKILREFEGMGITATDGNIIFPAGNALKYLKEYFVSDRDYANPYDENPEDIHTASISPNGDLLGGNIYQTDVLDILKQYTPPKEIH